MNQKLVKKIAVAGAFASTLAPIAARAADYNYDYSTSTTDTAAAGGIVAAMLIFWGIFAIVALALFIFWIVMLVDAMKRTNWNDDNQKTMWLVILIVGLIIGLGGLAAIVYYFAVKRALDKPKAAPVAPSAPVSKK